MKRDQSLDRLRRAYDQGGLDGIASTLAGYLRWRLEGSPTDPHEPTEMKLERVDAALVVVLMRAHYSKRRPDLCPLISVILPTKDRPDLLWRAAGSVLDQSYSNWELLVIDDGDTPVQPSWDDERVLLLPNRGRGVSAARNTGLDRARGDLIAYLDDDNLMDPLWLNALALTLEETPDATAMIGAQIVTPEPGSPERHTIRFPSRFDWRQLTQANYIDMGMLAHRPIDIRFDEELPALVDWDFVVRLTQNRDPLLVPAVSGTYLTASTGRVSYRDRRKLVKRLHRRFASLAPPTHGAGGALGRHDFEALGTMLARLETQKARRPVVLAGESDSIAISVAEALGETGKLADSGDVADILLVHHLPTPPTMDRLAEDALVVVLTASQVDHQSLALPYSRHVGDDLWIGSRKDFDAESLFEGATLVKFGRTTDR